YAASSGGSSIGNSSSGVNWTTPSISTTTIYYAEANDGGCTSAARTAVTATVLNPPGGVASNLKLWLKADAGTSTTTDAVSMSTWTDQSTNAYSASGYSAGGKYYENGINFNPTITFDGNNDYYTISDGIIGDGINIDDAFVYYVGTFDDANSKMSVFHESCNDAVNGNNNSYWKFQREADGDIWYGKGRAGSSYSSVFDDWGGVSSQPYLWTAVAASNTSTPQGTNKYITRNDNLILANNGTSNAEGNGGDFYIGANNAGNDDFDGNISELIIYEGVSSATDEDKIQSYLALKYGITMGTTASTFSYLSADGTTIWAGNATFQNGVAGIGRDDLSGLHQKQSKSVNYDAIVTMSTQAIAADNDANTTSLDDGEFLMWGNNNASASAETDMPSGYTGRLEKEWVVEMTGTVSNVHVEFDLGELHNLAGDGAGDYYLLIDSDGDFTSGASETAASTLTGNNKITFNDINFTDGYYFTLGTKQSAPGGVGTHLQAWWKADAGTATTTDDASNASWTDQSSHGFVANQTTTGADYWENGINFNPVLRFTGSNEDFTVTNGIYGNTTRDNMFTYVVCTRAATGAEHNVISQQLLSSDLYGMLFWSNNDTYYYEGDNLETTGRIKHPWGGTVDQPHLWVGGAAESASTPGGNFKYLMRDNTMYDNTTGTSTVSGGTNDLVIGSGPDGAGDYNGDIAEIIILDGIPSALEEDQIQSYLAIKYGITLASSDYYNSAGTVVWDNSTYSAYHYDVAGIGRDDNGTLLQKQSKSINSDAIVTMSTEAIAADNDANSTTLTDGTYLLWGNNNSTSNAYDDLPAGYSGRLKKEWVVEMTGTVENVHVEFDLSDHDYLGGDAAADFYLITDADGDFTSGASEIAASSLSGTKVTFDDIDFTDGQYFTLGTKQPGPGGVANNVLLWLKADAGTNTTTNDERVTSWVSQGTSSFTANEVSSAGPTYKTDGINGHPALDFS
ncbi:MAG: hypothetical protein P8Q42_12470, partial [Flavobacteriales bacterium]|nr:hypothetical protein [Flavobacteriales bacterium]